MRLALDGYNASLIATGASGTGKTYTVHDAGRLGGSSEGLAPRMLRMVLERAHAAQAAGAHAYEVTMQYLHVRDELVFDLLATDAADSPLPLREDAQGVYAKGATCVALSRCARRRAPPTHARRRVRTRSHTHTYPTCA